ncbi:MAG: class I SAM-dependent methyltransferase [Actinomycetota bacterium]
MARARLWGARRGETGSPEDLPALPDRQDDPLLQGWYHTIEFPGGLVSRGNFDHRKIVGRYGIPASLKGKTVLDVGAADGYFSFEMEKRGASRVVALDVPGIEDCDWTAPMHSRVAAQIGTPPPWTTHFLLARHWLGSKVERLEINIYDLTPEAAGKFDVVFCGDVLLHLQNPLKALTNICAVTKEMAIVETVIDPVIEHQFPGAPYARFGSRADEVVPGEVNTFWRMNSSGLKDMLEYAGFGDVQPQGTFALPPEGTPVTAMIATPGRGGRG